MVKQVSIFLPSYLSNAGKNQVQIKREARENQEINDHTNDNKSTISTQIGINTL